MQLIIDFNQWCLEEQKKTGLPAQMMCQRAINEYKGKLSADFIRKHVDPKFKQKYRSNNAKKGWTEESKITRLKNKIGINVNDIGVLLHESAVMTKK